MTYIPIGGGGSPADAVTHSQLFASLRNLGSEPAQRFSGSVTGRLIIDGGLSGIYYTDFVPADDKIVALYSTPANDPPLYSIDVDTGASTLLYPTTPSGTTDWTYLARTKIGNFDFHWISGPSGLGRYQFGSAFVSLLTNPCCQPWVSYENEVVVAEPGVIHVFSSLSFGAASYTDLPVTITPAGSPGPGDVGTKVIKTVAPSSGYQFFKDGGNRLWRVDSSGVAVDVNALGASDYAVTFLQYDGVRYVYAGLETFGFGATGSIFVFDCLTNTTVGVYSVPFTGSGSDIFQAIWDGKQLLFFTNFIALMRFSPFEGPTWNVPLHIVSTPTSNQAKLRRGFSSHARSVSGVNLYTLDAGKIAELSSTRPAV